MHRRPSTMWEQPSSCPRLPRRRKMMQLLAGAGLIAFVVSLALHQDQAGSRPLYIDGGHWATDHGALRLEEAEALRPLAAACIERGMWLEYTTKTQPSKLKNAQTEENWAGSAGLEVDGIDLADGLGAIWQQKRANGLLAFDPLPADDGVGGGPAAGGGAALPSQRTRTVKTKLAGTGSIVRFEMSCQPGRQHKPAPPGQPGSLPSVRALFGERGQFNFLKVAAAAAASAATLSCVDMDINLTRALIGVAGRPTAASFSSVSGSRSTCSVPTRPAAPSPSTSSALGRPKPARCQSTRSC